MDLLGTWLELTFAERRYVQQRMAELNDEARREIDVMIGDLREMVDADSFPKPFVVPR